MRAFFVLLILSPFIACKSKDKKAAIKDDRYLDYKIIAEEGNDNLVVIAHFRDEDEQGDAKVLTSPAAITFDGQPMQADSSKYSGVLYEAYRPIDSFSGQHQFSFTDGAGEKHETSFSFVPLQLETPIPDTISRDDLPLQLTGAGPRASIRIIMIDTSFINEGVNQLQIIENGNLLIPASAFENVSEGPVQLELVLEKEKKLDGEKRGRVLILYTLRREFFLKD